MIFMEAILPIAQFDYLEPYWSDMVVKVLNIDVEAQELTIFGGYQDVTDQILTLGYENQSSLLNLGTISLFMAIYFVKLVVFLIICLPLKHFNYDKYIEMRDAVFFQDLIDIITESFIELVISGYISHY